jgi:hypothetical protein
VKRLAFGRRSFPRKTPRDSRTRSAPIGSLQYSRFGALFALRFLRAGAGTRAAAPFSASGILPPLRSGQFSVDEAEHFTAQSSCQRRYAPMVFGIIPERRSASLRN